MSDQVTHTPTPWTVSYGSSDWGMGCVHSIVPAVDRDTIIAEVQSVTPYCIGASAADKNLASTQRANAKFIVLAVNSHDALTARVAELESANAMWQQNSRDAASAMLAMRNAINEYVPIQSIEGDLHRGPETSVFCEIVATAVTGRVAELEAENERLRELIECAALYLDAFEGDIMEIDPEVLTGIPLSPTNMAAGLRATLTKPGA